MAQMHMWVAQANSTLIEAATSAQAVRFRNIEDYLHVSMLSAMLPRVDDRITGVREDESDSD